MTEMVTNEVPASNAYLEKMNKFWRAANYLSACQLYLLDNPLLKKPLTPDMIKKKRRDFSRLFKILLFCLRTGSEPTELPEKQGSES